MTLNDKLKAKRILFFSVRVFSIEQDIKRVLEEAGALVDYFDERPSNSTFTKGIIRIKREVYKSRIDQYYQRILKEIEGKQYDYLLVNRGEVIPVFFLKAFKKQQMKCECILYTWDSIANQSHPLEIRRYFDYCFTFDSKDSEEYNMYLRPLFFRDPLKEVKTQGNGRIEYDLLFLGTAHTDRYEVSHKIMNWCAAHQVSTYVYYYIQGRAVYWYKRAFDKSFKKFDYHQLSFRSLNVEEVKDLYGKSRVFLDINHPDQKGLTMRTLEAIGCGRKLITTNAEIKRYPFYHSDNILLIDREEPHLEKAFFDTNYVEHLSPNMYHRLTLKGWLEDLFLREDLQYWNQALRSSL